MELRWRSTQERSFQLFSFCGLSSNQVRRPLWKRRSLGSLLFSFPAVIRASNPKLVYLGSQLLATAAYASLLVLRQWPAAAIAVIASSAINFAAFNSIPFALVSGLTAGANGGLYMGVLNSAAVVSQVISINAVAVPVIKSTGDTTWGIASGALFGLLALVWGMVCVTGRPEKKSAADEETNERRPLIQHVE